MRSAWCIALLLAAFPGTLAAQDFQTLKGHGGPIMGIAVSPEGVVATASFDNSVGLWNGGTPAWLEGHDAAVTTVAFGPNGLLVSGGDDFAVRAWGQDPQLLGLHRGKVACVAVSPGGDMIASGSWDGSIRLWPRAGGVAGSLSEPGSGVNDIAFSSDGRRLFAATTGGDLLRYDLDAGGAPVPLARHGFGINRLVLGEGWVAYGAVDGQTRVIDSETGAEIADFTLERRPILAMAHHSPTGQIAVGDGQGYIMMLETVDWRIARDFRATREGPVWALAFSPDGSVIYAGGLDAVVYAWPVAMLDAFDPAMGQERTFLRDAATMPNGERQFMRKCSICHDTGPDTSRKAGPTLHRLFGRRAGTVPGYPYSPTLDGSDIVWTAETVDSLFDAGPDHFIPGSKMPMQVIAADDDRADLIRYLETATTGG